MRLYWTLARLFARSIALWGLFTLVLLLAGGGLAMLSQHTLRLSQQHSLSQAREETLQNLRLSLWQLDSRLGPFVATLHDPVLGGNYSGVSNRNFVIQRFKIELATGVKGESYVFVPSNDGMEIDSSSWTLLTQEIPVAEVVNAVEEIIPFANMLALQSSNQAFVQNNFLNAPLQQTTRGQRELRNRDEAVQSQVGFNTMDVKGKPTQKSDPPTETKLMPVWIGDHLVVVRASRTFVGELEGVWVDWPALRQSLIAEIADLLPGASFHPVRRGDTIDPERTLAAIPAMVNLPVLENQRANRWSPTHTALAFAWCALLVSTVLAAIALNRLIALSERRASFVSAVTHELRTPLTTFRLYTDLLSRNMIQDPQARQEYLQTLRREADRLTHLVDNVLRYSKLQSTSKRAALENVLVSEWLERITPRLVARLATADMRLVVDQHSDGLWATDPPAMEQVLFNLVDNAAKYASSATDRRVLLAAKVEGTAVTFTVTDHGPGVPEKLRSTIFRPFAKSAERAAETAAGVGLGLALARQTAIALGGKLDYQTTPDGGASFRVHFPSGCQRVKS
jgi:signal transduction histidine kinase